MKVNNIFCSYQGEGFFTGTKAVFIRLAGCNLKCWFCDTNFDLKKDMSEDEIVKEVLSYDTDLVVITGGEPLLQNLKILVKKLWEKNKIINIETNGTIAVPNSILSLSWITCSPKPGWKIKYCDELKVVVDKPDIDLSEYDKINCKRRTLQPVDVGGKMNFSEVLKLAQGDKRWKIGIQLHKIYEIE